jgi:UDP-glucose 4-epimerase/UDP-glucuronate decarboxylase
MNERILITGGAGFIGLALAQAAVQRGARVTLLDNFSRGRRDMAFTALCDRVAVVEHDLTLPIPENLLREDYTAVYHLAAMVGVQQSNTLPYLVLRTNLLCTMHLLDWCTRARPRALFFSSTSEVADGAVRVGLAELPTSERLPLVIDAPHNPRSTYAASKLTGELLCLNYARTNSMRIRIGRYHNIYGPRMGYEHVIPQLIERALKRLNPFTVYGPQQYRAFCYVDDAIEATLALMQLDTEEPLLVNIGNDQQVTQIGDLARAILALADFDPEIDEAPAPPGSPERRCPDISSLSKLTGYRPAVSLQAGLQRTFSWYQKDWNYKQERER